jgi:hypothetical protein
MFTDILALTKVKAYQVMSNEAIPRTKYQEWMQSSLNRKGWSASVLAKNTGLTYHYVWRLAFGDPEKYPAAKKPKYQNALIIGEALGDVEGSLKAAGLDLPPGSESSTTIKAKLDSQLRGAGELLGKLERIKEEFEDYGDLEPEFVTLFTGLSPRSKADIFAEVRRRAEQEEREKSIGGGVAPSEKSQKRQ